MIVNVGKTYITSLVGANALYVALGSSSVAVSATQTALVTEFAGSGLSRKLGTASIITSTIGQDTVQITAGFSVTGAGTIMESGLFNASSGGSMLARQLTSVVSVENHDNYVITWKVTNS